MIISGFYLKKSKKWKILSHAAKPFYILYFLFVSQNIKQQKKISSYKWYSNNINFQQIISVIHSEKFRDGISTIWIYSYSKEKWIWIFSILKYLNMNIFKYFQILSEYFYFYLDIRIYLTSNIKKLQTILVLGFRGPKWFLARAQPVVATFSFKN